VTGQLIAIAKWGAVTARRVLTWWAVVASVVKAAFWAWTVVATTFKTRSVAAEFAVAAKFTTAFVAALTASISTPTPLWAATS